MRTIIVTGGIATGKSSFCRRLMEREPHLAFFDCDKTVHALLTSAEIVAKLQESFGDSILDSEGRVDRATLRDLIFRDPDCKSALEGILHPEVRRLCIAAQVNAGDSGRVSLYVADVPLFFENQFPLEHDMTVVVATTRATQLQRLMQRSPIPLESATQIIDAQLPIEHKVARADSVIWNGGSLLSLNWQIDYFLKWMQQLSK